MLGDNIGSILYKIRPTLSSTPAIVEYYYNDNRLTHTAAILISCVTELERKGRHVRIKH